ncbi:MAG: YCF48-related protein [Ignavibacteriales bacterium]|nr:YCF48-related protein [Ignavibacteriales bacterium]
MKRVIIILFLISYYQITINAQWIKQSSGTDEKLTDVIMIDSLTAIAVGKGRSILRTSDAGKSWKNLTIMLSSTVPWNGVSFLDTSCGIATGDGGIRITSDGGRTWLWHSAPYFQNYISQLYLAPGNIYIGADSGWICHSLDSGKTWASEKISNSPIRSIFSWRGPYIQSLPIYALTSNSLYRKMEFPSGNWEEIATFFHGLGSEAFDGEFSSGSGPGYIVGVQGDLRAAPTVLRNEMSDSVWLSVSSEIIGDGVFFGISAPSQKVVYVCGNNGLIFKSSDSGGSWTKEIVPTTKNINAIYFFNESRGFGVGDSGLILYKAKDVAAQIENHVEQLPNQFILFQNFPNPFNPTTKISFWNSKFGFVSLKVYDILGNEVATLVNEEIPLSGIAGNYEVEFNGGNLSSGIYFYQLKAGNFSQTKKLILMK